ncbi:uncharacterized protein K444DRAFT_371610 [Hyaloscypha bicolor E]|uniref:Uncharacterized protein n=1 Tax=Hyaloscypha bicolor E TaxID=1095630 RepID=A0A2J6TEL8_9HELO|nr:uncharacterized protein K444DRAFT_371610 [Hyaloscypha bicolor E]PMD61485.1 hypothetical protein K444DRAFT_371610 [Hyaloscypha bicolor E]
MEAKGIPTHPFDTNTCNKSNLNCSYSASTTSNNQEWIPPFRFLDQPREVRDMVYNSSLSCPRESLQTVSPTAEQQRLINGGATELPNTITNIPQ